MKAFRLIAFAFFLALLSLPRIAAADDGWYEDLELGRSNFSDNPFALFGLTAGYTTDLRDTAWRFAGGYQFDDYFGLEAGYEDLGQAHMSFKATPGIGFFHETVKAHGYPVEAVGTWPLTASWSLYGRAGAFFNHTEDDEIQAVPAGQSVTLRSDDAASLRSTGYTYGVGVAWACSQRFKFRFGFDRYDQLVYNGAFGNQGGHYSVNVLALGVVYSFN